MPKQYHRPRGIDGQLLNVIYYTKNNKTISVPFDNANTDYQEYLKWVAKGNKAMELEEAK